MCYANDFYVRLRVLTDLVKDYGLGDPGLITGRMNFGWLAVWVLSLDLLIRKENTRLLSGVYLKPPRLGGSANRVL